MTEGRITEETIKWEKKMYYDPRYGRFIRHMRSSQPEMVASNASTQVTAAGGTVASGGICSTTMSATEEGYMTSYGMSHSSTAAEMWFIDGNSTIVPQRINSTERTQCQITTIDAPFYRLDASQTIDGQTDTSGSVCQWCSIIVFPIISSVETR